MSSRWLVLLILAVGCDDLSGQDDPRLNAGFQENGSCDGLAMLCEYRSIAACNAGCAVADDCHPVTRDRCAEHATADACDADASYCQWSADACEVSGIYCSGDYSKTACDADSAMGCTWGPDCTGYPDGCYELDTRSACTGRPGCTWTPTP